MQTTNHKILYKRQPGPTSCSPTALSMILEHYGKSISPQEIEATVPQIKKQNGENGGTITQLLAAWSATKGFRVSLYTFDCQIVDQSWTGLASQDITARLEAGLNGRIVPGLGEDWSRAYRQSYIDYLKTGNMMTIEPSVTSKLLYDLLKNGPIFGNVCVNTLYGTGRTKDDTPDDINGLAGNHSIVIYGNNAHGNFLIADPIMEPGLQIVEKERIIAAITAAQIECDNIIFQLESQ